MKEELNSLDKGKKKDAVKKGVAPAQNRCGMGKLGNKKLCAELFVSKSNKSSVRILTSSISR